MYVSYHLPPERAALTELAPKIQVPAVEANVFAKFFGLKEFPIDTTLTTDEILLIACQRCLHETQINPHKIKWLLHTHTGNHVTPFGESIVRKLKYQLGLHHAHSFGMCLSKCGAIVSAFALTQLLLNELAADEYILLLTGDVTFTAILQYIPGTTIMSDGGAAILVAKQAAANTLLAYEIKIFGEFAGGIWGEKQALCEFEKNYVHRLAAVIASAVNKAGLTMNDIRLILPHNVNTFSWQNVAKALNVPLAKIFLHNIAKTGHCFGTDPFLNYRDALDAKMLQPGNYFVMATLGLGATFAAMVFKH